MKRNPRKNPQSGFALIVTLSLMILLTVIAVGLLSLSSISLRTTGQGNAASVARSNARLAMMIALGELQKSMGPDTSVSATSESVISDPGRPHLTGAWQRPLDNSMWPSWHWTPSTNQSPDYASKKSTFKGWLVSTTNLADELVANLPTSQITGKEIVTLVGDTSDRKLVNNGIPIQVDAGKVKVGSVRQKGKFAWVVFDESTKAPISLGDPAIVQDPGTEIASRTVPNRVHADVIDEQLSSLKDPVNLISLDTAAIPAGKGKGGAVQVQQRFHDFTTDSVGLLTDTANGGLKTDLTSLFEGNSLPSGNSPYPSAFTTAMGVPTWTYIRSHYLKYKTVTSTGSTPTYAPTSDLTQTSAGSISSPGQVVSPIAERLLPVISKFQLIFSIVAHNASDQGRRNWLNDNATNAQGQKDGYLNHGIPHLAYDPVVTLYNPYDVALRLTNIRVRVWDPPVGFRLSKLPGGFIRKGDFDGLGTFTNHTDGDSQRASPKYFTMILSDGTQAAAGNDLKLLPGEVKVFSTRVENNWNWALETGNGNKRSFFDWSADDFSNVDYRPGTKFGAYGVEAIPGWEPRAGLQTDHLSYGNNRRPVATLYPYENPSQSGAGFVTIRKKDSVQVEVEPYINNPATQIFQLDLLAGKNTDVARDLLRRYKFTIANPINELSRDPRNPIIKRAYTIESILQTDSDTTSAFKKPFAMLEVTARTTKDSAETKPWLYNNPVVEGGNQSSSSVGMIAQSYDIRLSEITSFASFPNGVSMDPDSKRGYFGGTAESASGSNFVTMYHVPVVPSASLGDLIPTNLVASSLLPRVVHPFGNSRAHPLIPADKVSRTLTGVGTMLDHSYLLNEGLWDKYYFSSLAAYPRGILSDARARADVLEGVYQGKTPAFNSQRKAPAFNSRLIPISTSGDPKKLADSIDSISDNQERSAAITKSLGVEGVFNLNSASVDAWRAVLSSLRGRTINGLDGASAVKWVYAPTRAAVVASKSFPATDKIPFVRTGKPLAGDGADNDIRWSGYTALTDGQVKLLANAIVNEIKERAVADGAPSLSISEFVNRRLEGASGLQSLAGLLQTAIDKSDINQSAYGMDSKPLSYSSVEGSRKAGVVTTQVLNDNSAEGAPSVLTQGDLMMALAPIATVRGDTFKIRTYGEATNSDGNPIATAWCEVVVQRMPDFVDGSDLPETVIPSLNPTNSTFGRRFNIVSFRWLSKEEI